MKQQYNPDTIVSKMGELKGKMQEAEENYLENMPDICPICGNVIKRVKL